GGELLRRRAQRDLETRGRRAEAVVAAVAGAAPVLADPDLRAALVREHLRGHRHAGVTEEDVRVECLALVGLHAVYDEVLALADAVLLATETDDRVVHTEKTRRQRGPRGAGSVARLNRSRRDPGP